MLQKTLRGILLVLLLIDTAAVDEVIKLSKKKYKFGEEITVKFKNPNKPLESNWIGIYRKNVALWLYTCGSQLEQDCDRKPSKKGKVTFRTEDPSSTKRQFFPVIAGSYSACLMDGNPNEPQYSAKIGECKDFKVKQIPKKKLKNSSVTPLNLTFKVGEPIHASFETRTSFPNMWIGVFSANNGKPKGEVGYSKFWVYSGCNNQKGDQKQSDQCANTREKGDISITNYQDGPVPEGQYYLCLVYMVNYPFDRFTCSERITVVPN